jgi:hypothetical protein
MYEYQPIKQVVHITMTCHNCHTATTINAGVEDEVRTIENWLKVQKSSGETFAYCGVACLQKGAHNLKPKSNIELVEG